MDDLLTDALPRVVTQDCGAVAEGGVECVMRVRQVVADHGVVPTGPAFATEEVVEAPDVDSKRLNDRVASREPLIVALLQRDIHVTRDRRVLAHAFLADEVADSIGWPAGSPFQLEVAFANLALGILGVLAMNRRDGFRDATVIAVTIFAGGATITHFTDIVETGNLAAGNTVVNVANVLSLRS